MVYQVGFIKSIKVDKKIIGTNNKNVMSTFFGACLCIFQTIKYLHNDHYLSLVMFSTKLSV